MDLSRADSSDLFGRLALARPGMERELATPTNKDVLTRLYNGFNARDRKAVLATTPVAGRIER